MSVLTDLHLAPLHGEGWSRERRVRMLSSAAGSDRGWHRGRMLWWEEFLGFLMLMSFPRGFVRFVRERNKKSTA